MSVLSAAIVKNLGLMLLQELLEPLLKVHLALEAKHSYLGLSQLWMEIFELRGS